VIKLFAGFDHREAIGFAVFSHSVITRATKPVSITPLAAMGLPQGSNAFTLSRFLVPWLCGFKGHAIFCDASDMLMLGDVAELDSLFDPQYAVQVVKHPDYKTKHRTKYRGTDMECPNTDYPRKNWMSVAIFNCEHWAWHGFTPEYLDRGADARVELQLANCLDEDVGELPDSWNRLVDEGQQVEGAKLLHWTAGIPGFEQYADAAGADLWNKERKAMNRGG
jgi:hypothetical protein